MIMGRRLSSVLGTLRGIVESYSKCDLALQMDLYHADMPQKGESMKFAKSPAVSVQDMQMLQISQVVWQK